MMRAALAVILLMTSFQVSASEPEGKGNNLRGLSHIDILVRLKLSREQRKKLHELEGVYRVRIDKVEKGETKVDPASLSGYAVLRKLLTKEALAEWARDERILSLMAEREKKIPRLLRDEQRRKYDRGVAMMLGFALGASEIDPKRKDYREVMKRLEAKLEMLLDEEIGKRIHAQGQDAPQVEAGKELGLKKSTDLDKIKKAQEEKKDKQPVETPAKAE